VRLLRILALYLAAACLLIASLSAQAYPSFEEVRVGYTPSDSWLLDRHGEVLQQVRINHDVRRLQWTRLEDISPALLQAMLYSEDKRFYEHAGVDWQAMLAAGWRNAWQTKTRGASTITMQLTGLLDEQPVHGRRNIGQKIGQSGAALWLDAKWRKDEILEAYLNLVTYRGELQGVAAMSAGLFKKAPAALDAREAALAAALIRSPNAKPAKVTKRACELLKHMQRAEACNDLEGFASLRLGGPFEITVADHAPHLARQLIHRAGERVPSTIEAPLQRYANQRLRANLLDLANQNAQDGAVLVLDNATGEVLAWVGSSGSLSEAGEVDGILAKRQAGSTLKPFLYALAIQKKSLMAASILDDSPVRITTPGGLYIPQNYDKQFMGPVTTRVALASSLNVPAVRTLLRVGGDAFVDELRSLGFSTLDQSADYYGYSLALGAADVRLLDLTNAYRALANDGQWRAVKTQPNARLAKPRAVLTPAASYIVSDLLSDNTARSHTFGMDSVLNTPYWTAVKTGTSKDMRDNWCIGYSRHYTVGVWLGNANGSPMHDVSGVSGAAPIWREVMDYLHHGLTGVHVASIKPALPTGVNSREIRFEPAFEPARRELFLSGTEQEVIVANKETAERLSANKERRNTAKLARIAYPGEGTIIALDPEIPPQLQRVVFKATVVLPSTWSWRLDGHKLDEDSLKHPWFPEPGRHQLQLLEAQSQLVDTVHFEVRGALRIK
jgi:penicillin-binding protein 1C